MKTIVVLVFVNAILHLCAGKFCLSDIESQNTGFLCIDKIHKKAEIYFTNLTEEFFFEYTKPIFKSSCSFLNFTEMELAFKSAQVTELKLNGLEYYEWVCILLILQITFIIDEYLFSFFSLCFCFYNRAILIVYSSLPSKNADGE